MVQEYSRLRLHLDFLRHNRRRFGSREEHKFLATLVDEMRKIGFLSQLLRLTLALSLTLVLSSCSIFGIGDSSAKTLWEQDDQYIRIVSQDAPKAPPNDHPVTLSSEQIKTVLGLLQVNFKQKEKTFSTRTSQNQAVFTEEQIDLLGDNLSRGLSKAGPRQDITFALVGFYRIGLANFVKVRRVVTGRVFYHDDRLNIVFGRIRGDYPEPKGAGALVAIPPERDMTPGSRTAPKPYKWTIKTEPGIDVYTNGSRARQDWVLIDPKAAIASAAARQQQAQFDQQSAAQGTEKLQEEATRLESEQQALREKVDQLEQELETVKQDQAPEGGVAAGAAVGVGAKTTVDSQTAGSADAVSTVSSGRTNGVSDQATEATLEQQLTLLKRLRDQDLISEEVYRERVEELLDEAL